MENNLFALFLRFSLKLRTMQIEYNALDIFTAFGTLVFQTRNKDTQAIYAIKIYFFLMFRHFLL